MVQMALRRGIQGARRMRSVQFGPGAIVPALFTQGWPALMQELEEMCTRLLLHSRNPYSTMRVTLTYSKRLKYSWQMCYWGNRTGALTADSEWGRLLGMNAMALRDMLTQHIESVTNQRVQLDQMQLVWVRFEQLPLMRDFFRRASDGTEEGIEALRRQCHQVFLTGGGEVLHPPAKRERAAEGTSGGPVAKAPRTGRGTAATTTAQGRGRGYPGRVTHGADRGGFSRGRDSQDSCGTLRGRDFHSRGFPRGRSSSGARAAPRFNQTQIMPPVTSRPSEVGQHQTIVPTVSIPPSSSAVTGYPIAVVAPRPQPS